MDQDIPVKLKKFTAQFKTVLYKKGEAIIRCDEESPSYIYFIKKGLVKQFFISDNGEELTLTIFKSGDYFPLLFTTNNFFNCYTFQAMGSVLMYRVPKDKLMEFLKNNPAATTVINNQLTTKLMEITEILENTLSSTSPSRIINVLASHRQRYGNWSQLTHKDIASLTGLSRETVCRQMKKLEKQGIIKKRD